MTDSTTPRESEEHSLKTFKLDVKLSGESNFYEWSRRMTVKFQDV
jgi:hypothetical protein